MRAARATPEEEKGNEKVFASANACTRLFGVYVTYDDDDACDRSPLILSERGG
jgi:hypothetical protein